MDNSSIENQRAEAKKRLLRLVAGLLAIAVAVAGGIFAVEHLKPKEKEADRSAMMLQAGETLAKARYGYYLQEQERTFGVRVEGSNVKAFKYVPGKNAASYYQLSGKIDYPSLGTEGIAQIALRCDRQLDDSLESGPTEKLRENDATLGKHDLRLAIVEITNDKSVISFADQGELKKVAFVVGTNDREDALRAEMASKSAEWKEIRRKNAEAAVKEKEEKAVEALFSDYPVGVPVCFELDAGWKDKLQSSAQKLSGKNETAAALASMDHFSDHVMWLVRTGDRALEVWYRSAGVQYGPVKLTTKTRVNPATGIVLDCNGEHPFGWRSLQLDLAKKTWGGDYAYGVGAPYI